MIDLSSKDRKTILAWYAYVGKATIVDKDTYNKLYDKVGDIGTADIMTVLRWYASIPDGIDDESDDNVAERLYSMLDNIYVR